MQDTGITMKKVFKIMDLLGCSIDHEYWYDEEGIEGTCITLPNGEEIKVWGWDEDCFIDELVENLTKALE